MKSTPVSATARSVSSDMLPDASSSVRELACLRATLDGIAHRHRARSCRAGCDRPRRRALRAAASRFSTSTSSRTFELRRRAALTAVGDRAGRGDVVFLDQDRVEQADAMIRAAAAAHGVFLREPQPRDRLARVEDAAPGARDGLDVSAGQRRGCGKRLQEVERSSFTGEQCARGAVDRAELLVGTHALAIVCRPGHTDSRVDLAKHFVEPRPRRRARRLRA